MSSVILYFFIMARPRKHTPNPIPFSVDVGKQLALWRKNRGFTQELLAETMGISQKQITDYETGKVHMNDEMIIRFALTLKVSADTLLGLKKANILFEKYNIRFTRRLKDIEQLSESKKRAIIKILDEFLRPA